MVLTKQRDPVCFPAWEIALNHDSKDEADYETIEKLCYEPDAETIQRLADMHGVNVKSLVVWESCEYV